MNPLGIIKTVSDIVVSVGAGAVVGNAIKATTPLDLTLVKKISLGVGGFVLSSMAGSYASKYVTDQIDSTTNQLKELKSTLKKKD